MPEQPPQGAPTTGHGEQERGIAAIRRLVDESSALQEALVEHSAQSILVAEGTRNPYIHVLMTGTVELRKQHGPEKTLHVDTLRPGELIGLFSFVSQESSLTSAIAIEPSQTLRFTADAFHGLADEQPQLHRQLQFLITENLAHRYRRMVLLHLELARLNKTLETEHNELRQTVEALNRTRDQLITQGKLATLGQLTAGLAHELNNPAAALTRATEYLRDTMAPVITQAAGSAADTANSLWNSGMEDSGVDTNSQRNNREALAKAHPAWPAALLRRAAQLPPDALEALLAQHDLPASVIEERLRYFESGRFLRTIRLAADRIRGLVTSLRNYSREGEGGWSEIDPTSGIRDTLLLLRNRLKEIHLTCDFPDPCPTFHGNAGELNQVWTNILVNACDALGNRGAIKITIARNDDNTVTIAFHDDGPGVPETLREKIFTPNFTTRMGKGHSFGLGLGLSISRSIVEKHGGTLSVEESPLGGACFQVRLPAAT